ncbi:MAG: transcription termination/antitermination protein NusA [Lachnospiraceae bacterium]|nr:transcription termination/antitermination protein NusA [Lachnospiraceae bacterium]
MSDERDLIEALNQIEKEKGIDKDILLDAIENSLLAACKNEFGKADNIRVNINRDTGRISVISDKEVVEKVTDKTSQISLADAKLRDENYQLGDKVGLVVTPKNFGRIAAGKAKQVVVQKIREEERKSLYNQYYDKEREVVTGIVQRYVGNNVSVNLGKVDAVLTEKEQVPGEEFRPTERIKLYVVDVRDTSRGPRITVSRTHPELVRRLFEQEVSEVRDGTIEIVALAREAGSRTKMAVWSNDENVDPVGACVGVNGSRVNAVVDELRGEKIDIINWSEDPEKLIENALNPAKVVYVDVDEEKHEASVVVPDYQLSLAIGKEGQNARLAARLTGYKIDIRSESQDAAERAAMKEAALLEEEEQDYDAPADEELTDETAEETPEEEYTEEEDV